MHRPTYWRVTTHVLVGTVAAGLALVFHGTYGHGTSGERGTTLRDVDAPYAFVKPLLACDVGATQESSSLSQLKSTLATIINNAITEGTAEHASVYYRVLDTGEWTAVNTDEDYAPASLMKVPVLLAYLKHAETDPELLARTVTITEDPAPGTAQDIAPSESVHVGETYTVEELLRLMSAYSDNRALNVLMQGVDIRLLDEILEDLGIPVPENQEGYTISPRLYSRLFRILYNATYLNETMSEKALHMLSLTEYDAGLVAGAGTETIVAHKFGEASTVLADGQTGHELHDCGIVYTENPYAICIMTKGKDVDALASLIARISQAAFE